MVARGCTTIRSTDRAPDQSAPAAALVWAMPEPLQIERPVRLRPQRLRLPTEVRAVFVRAALAGFAGFSVLGLFAAVAPGLLRQRGVR